MYGSRLHSWKGEFLPFRPAYLTSGYVFSLHPHFSVAYRTQLHKMIIITQGDIKFRTGE
ncbi:hypothetical protein CLOHYLEM_04406 [[Clostridium] hylemonae DSM 15053]|uniref:Uncharacterized protein n=1 Tax=[Clostridium] hylemonae DSM 15053 TaxID=553973 RepID=C0BX68_9FIRM|nr:hypothetical protein CLOHYLEM_04406 [[Clostridium] hylemonae DSM 15053]